MTPPPPSSPPPPQHNNTNNDDDDDDDDNHICLPSSPSSSSSSISSGHNSPPQTQTHITTTTPSHSPPPQQVPSNHLPISAPDSPNRSSIASYDHSLHDIKTTNEIDTNDSHTTTPLHEISPHVPSSSPAPVVNRLIRDEPALVVTKVEPHAPTGHAEERGDDVDSRVGGGGGRGGKGSGVRLRVRKEMLSMKRDKKSEVMVRRVGLGLRVFEFLSCLVSFSVMAADQGRGWALDSFDRYLEFRYCISASILGFAFSGFQGLDLVYQLTTRDLKPRQFLRRCFDFTSDQILAYLLVSASSSAAARTDDWITNWGKDKFPAMAGASVGMSFLAFLAFALSSVISGYVLCTRR